MSLLSYNIRDTYNKENNLVSKCLEDYWNMECYCDHYGSNPSK